MDLVCLAVIFNIYFLGWGGVELRGGILILDGWLNLQVEARLVDL